MLGRLTQSASSWDLEAAEMAIRASLHEVGGRLLQQLLNSDGGGYKGARVACGAGHEASFIDYRSKEVTTVLARITIKRAYYHIAPGCAAGVLPKDQELDIVGTSFSPGARRLMGRVGGKESFNEGRQDLEELAGIKVKTKEDSRSLSCSRAFN